MISDEEKARREAALLKLEAAAEKMHLFVHGDADTVIETESGDLPTLHKLRAELAEHAESSVDFIGAVSSTMKSIAVEVEEVAE